jgi:hypothetical protein
VEDEEADEIDLSVEASDAAIVEEVALEANEQEDMPTLTCAEVNLGHWKGAGGSQEGNAAVYMW